MSFFNRLQSLIVREWLWAGHPFAKRNKKLGVSLSRYKGQGSVFLLFLDAVHQVSRTTFVENSRWDSLGLSILCKQFQRQHLSISSITRQQYNIKG